MYAVNTLLLWDVWINKYKKGALVGIFLSSGFKSSGQDNGYINLLIKGDPKLQRDQYIHKWEPVGFSSTTMLLFIPKH